MTVITSKYDRDELDFYVEPVWCVECLLDNERFVGGCLDPAAGLRTIPKVLTERGHNCFMSDITNRGQNTIREFDFLGLGTCSLDFNNIICNPPFKHAVPFCLKALDVARHKVAMLLPLTFLASQKRKAEIFDPHPPARVYVLSRRPSMPPGQMLIEDPNYVGKGGSVDYCWVVWDHGAKGPTQIEWSA